VVRHSQFALFALTSAAAGCGELTSVGRDAQRIESAVDGGHVIACEELPLEACSGDPRCFTFKARKFDATRSCAARTWSRVACGTREADFGGCGEALTEAHSPSGETFEFPSRCIPLGWELYPSSLSNLPQKSVPDDWPACELDTSCDSRDLSVCANDGRCELITARRFDARRLCVSTEQTPVGCRTATSSCGTATTYGRGTGDTYVFTDTCLPASFSRLELADLGVASTSTPRSAWPTCAPESACTELSLDTCAAQAGCELLLGRPFDLARMCIGPQMPAACVAAGRSCPPDIKYASDGITPSSLWEFGGCTPPDWKRLESDAQTLPKTTCP
jgi:hypothetical protein